MITEEYIQELMARANIQGSAAFVTGYDAALALIENRTAFPFIIVEDSTNGVLSADYGGVDSISQSIWVMCSINERDGIGKNAASRQAKLLMRKIVALLLEDKDNGDLGAEALDISSMPYFARNTAIAAGWELQLTFNETDDLTMSAYE